MQEELRKEAKNLLEGGEIQLIIGYGDATIAGETTPVFIRRLEEAQKLVWNNRCFNNLAVYLSRPEVKRYKQVAIVAKGCDTKAIVGLLQEEQIIRDWVHIIGLSCNGVGEPLLAKCVACDVRRPSLYDTLIGDKAEKAEREMYTDVYNLESKTREERWQFWQEQLSHCIKCYACRQACPLCYCKKCIAEKNLPQWIDTSPHLKGNFAWHIHRAFHLAGRCIGCGECERACPMDIPITLINRKLTKDIENLYGYRAGYDAEAKPVFTSYAQTDTQEFIE